MTPRQRLDAYENFTAFVRTLLRGRTLAQVATRSGVHKSTVMRWARGSEPHLDVARRVIDSFG